jgi:TolA-binding protein
MVALNLKGSKPKWARWLAALAVMAALAGPMRSQADSRQERRDYTFATNLFADGNYRQAEMEFNKFVASYTNSTRLTDALLFLARSRMGQSNYAGALDLLRQKLPREDATVLHYTALAYYGAGEYTNAVASCARLLGELPADSPSRLGVVRLEAQALSQLQDWPRVIALLSNPEGVFQRASRDAPGDPEAVNGFFLLGEAYLKERRYQEGEPAVRQADTNLLTRELKWKRDYLLCRIMLEAGRTEEALTQSVELAALQASQSERIATAFLQGEILERLNRTADAVDAYTKNLAQGLPAETNRKALSKTVELTEREEAIQRLEDFIGRRPKDPSLDLARWYLGDLCLQAYFAPPEAGTNGPGSGDTNYLRIAVTNLARLIEDYPESELLGKARLDLGWSDWAQGRFAEAKTNFLQAVMHLAYCEDRAVAILKLADAQFKEGDYQDAARHYNQLLADYATMGSVTNGLFDRALYQLAQADIKLGDEKGAEEAAEHIVDWYRDSGFGGRSRLLLGENSSRQGEYSMARAKFTNFLQAYPNSALQPKIQIAIARTYEQEGDWSNAVSVCEDWLANSSFAGNPLRPQVEFARALDCGKAGMESKALTLMTNFVSQYQSNSAASNSLAPLAQNWIGDYYRNHGDNANAHYAYQNLWLKFPNAEDLIYQARLMAGRAAEVYDLPQASNDFLVLTENTNTPAAILGEAWFQLGYTDFLQFQANRTNKALLSDALTALGHVTNASPSNALAPQALGQVGNCWLAWAPLDPVASEKTNDLTTAARMFQAELELPQADVTARSQGEYGLGMVAQALNRPPEEALNHYLRVVYNEVIHDESAEKPDPVWVKEAGVAAWQLCEEMKDWKDATNIYARVKAAVPTLGAEMERKIIRAASNIPASGN